MKQVSTVYILLMCTVVIACESRREVAIEDYKKYIANPANGLVKTDEENEIRIEVQYRPNALMVYHQVGSDATAEEWNKTALEFDSLEYFVLRLSHKGNEVENSFVGDASKFNNLLKYLNGGISEDIGLRSNVKLDIVNILYSRSFGTGNATNLLLVFKGRLSKKHDVELVWTDSFFGTGRHVFVFERSDLQDIPFLKL